MKPTIEKITSPANILVTQLVMEMINESLENKIETFNK
jgi:hypothetical protein